MYKMISVLWKQMKINQEKKYKCLLEIGGAGGRGREEARLPQPRASLSHTHHHTP